MTKEDKQIIDRAVKENWRIGDRTRLKHLLEKNLTQFRENAELENKIADIKANCDLAIEGRDVRIIDLEKENSNLIDVINNQDVKIVDLEKENAELKSELVKKADTNHSLVEQMADLESKNAELKEKVENLQKYLDTQNSYRECAETWLKLAKAKEYITEFMRISCASVEEYEPEFSELIGKAEQFLRKTDIDNAIQKADEEKDAWQKYYDFGR